MTKLVYVSHQLLREASWLQKIASGFSPRRRGETRKAPGNDSHLTVVSLTESQKGSWGADSKIGSRCPSDNNKTQTFGTLATVFSIVEPDNVISEARGQDS